MKTVIMETMIKNTLAVAGLAVAAIAVGTGTAFAAPASTPAGPIPSGGGLTNPVNANILNIESSIADNPAISADILSGALGTGA